MRTRSRSKSSDGDRPSHREAHQAAPLRPESPTEQSDSVPPPPQFAPAPAPACCRARGGRPPGVALPPGLESSWLPFTRRPAKCERSLLIGTVESSRQVSGRSHPRLRAETPPPGAGGRSRRTPLCCAPYFPSHAAAPHAPGWGAFVLAPRDPPARQRPSPPCPGREASGRSQRTHAESGARPPRPRPPAARARLPPAARARAAPDASSES